MFEAISQSWNKAFNDPDTAMALGILGGLFVILFIPMVLIPRLMGNKFRKRLLRLIATSETWKLEPRPRKLSLKEIHKQYPVLVIGNSWIFASAEADAYTLLARQKRQSGERLLLHEEEVIHNFRGSPTLGGGRVSGGNHIQHWVGVVLPFDSGLPNGVRISYVDDAGNPLDKPEVTEKDAKLFAGRHEKKIMPWFKTAGKSVTVVMKDGHTAIWDPIDSSSLDKQLSELLVLADAFPAAEKR